MLCNIIDRRKRCFRWMEVNVIIESTWHDNSCKDADQELDRGKHVSYEENRGLSLHDAIAWAESTDGKVTLYLYDKDVDFRTVARGSLVMNDD